MSRFTPPQAQPQAQPQGQPQEQQPNQQFNQGGVGTTILPDLAFDPRNPATNVNMTEAAQRQQAQIASGAVQQQVFNDTSSRFDQQFAAQQANMLSEQMAKITEGNQKTQEQMGAALGKLTEALAPKEDDSAQYQLSPEEEQAFRNSAPVIGKIAGQQVSAAMREANQRHQQQMDEMKSQYEEQMAQLRTGQEAITGSMKQQAEAQTQEIASRLGITPAITQSPQFSEFLMGQALNPMLPLTQENSLLGAYNAAVQNPNAQNNAMLESIWSGYMGAQSQPGDVMPNQAGQSNVRANTLAQPSSSQLQPINVQYGAGVKAIGTDANTVMQQLQQHQSAMSRSDMGGATTEQVMQYSQALVARLNELGVN